MICKGSLVGFALACAAVAAGCAKPVRPDPTAQEWEHAVDEAPTARPRLAPELADPKLGAPGDGAHLGREELARDQGVAVFTWSSSGPGVRYTLEIADDPGFTRLVFVKQDIPRNSYAYRRLRDGRYFWRVRTEGGRVSNVQVFSVGG
ncbi:MAG: hypothetical protein HY075_11845 [Deltaproteobacteria bacterium]|nr:hypothetical protein [Deltaproteobacteria bacterium]